MYTGIIHGTEAVNGIIECNGYYKIRISNDNCFFNDISSGASVSINGVCLTVTGIDDGNVNFDISRLTLENTTLQFLKEKDLVNIERSYCLGHENGGHSLYGHIEGISQVRSVIPDGETIKIIVFIPGENIKYFFNKGFIGLHGCSLTIHDVDNKNSTVSLNLIPETLRLTTFKSVREGDFLNYEVEQSTRTIVDTILSALSSHKK